MQFNPYSGLSVGWHVLAFIQICRLTDLQVAINVLLTIFLERSFGEMKCELSQSKLIERRKIQV